MVTDSEWSLAWRQVHSLKYQYQYKYFSFKYKYKYQVLITSSVTASGSDRSACACRDDYYDMDDQTSICLSVCLHWFQHSMEF